MSKTPGTLVKAVRVTPGEWERWRGFAEAEGLPLNTWIRSTLNDAAGRPLTDAEIRAAREKRDRRDRIAKEAFPQR